MRANYRQMEGWFIDPRLADDLGELKRQHASWGGDRPQSLWLTCRDKAVDHIVERVLSLKPAFVLRRPCDDVRNGVNLLRWPVQVITHAIEVMQVSEIVICGHSECEKTDTRRTLGGAPSHQGIEAILQRVERRLERIKSEQRHVIDQLLSLHEMPAVREAIAAGRLVLQGTFYLAESGTYLEYNSFSGDFRPIEGASPSAS